MMYAVLCFTPEERELMPRSQSQEDELMARLSEILECLRGVG